MARPSLSSVGSDEPAAACRTSNRGRSHNVAHGLSEPGAFRHSIANDHSNRNPGAKTKPDAAVFPDPIAIANRYRIAHFDTGPDSELTSN